MQRGGFLGKLNTLPSLVSQFAPPAEGGRRGDFLCTRHLPSYLRNDQLGFPHTLFSRKTIGLVQQKNILYTVPVFSKFPQPDFERQRGNSRGCASSAPMHIRLLILHALLRRNLKFCGLGFLTYFTTDYKLQSMHCKISLICLFPRPVRSQCPNSNDLANDTKRPLAML